MSTSKIPYKDFNINGDESGILKRNLRPSKNTDKHWTKPGVLVLNHTRHLKMTNMIGNFGLLNLEIIPETQFILEKQLGNRFWHPIDE